MTQQEQDEFDQSLDSALCWIKQIQTRLESNDNTQGPMEALEGRVRETEEICEFEHEGIARVDMVLSASKPLIQNGSEETRAETRSKLRELKTLWEETSTYIIHCHSRVKWVWLHWCEYVRAYEGFWSWLTKVHSEVMRYPELQLGTREKLWQLDQHRVLLIDIQHHAEPLERLLDEAATLHSKTQDPSLEPQAMENLQDVYRQVLHKAQERVATLEKIVEEQQTYNSSVQNFQAWLATQNHELNQYLEDEKSTEDKNSTLQEIFEKVSGKEELLQQMEHVAEEVKACSSPDGSLQVVREMEALRQAWEGLRERVLQEKESKRSSMLSQQALVSQCEELHEEVTRLHAIVKSLNQQLKELEEDTQSRRENNMARDWQQTVNVYNMVTSEGPRVEQLKIRLGELIKQSRNATSIFNEVLAVIKEFHGVKHRASKLFLEMKSNFHQSLQDLFQDFSQWRQKATKFLEMSEESAEISHIAMLMKSIEELRQYGSTLQERLNTQLTRLKLTECVLGPNETQNLTDKLLLVVRDRTEVQDKLLEKTTHLQGLQKRMSKFEEMYQTTIRKLFALRELLNSVDLLQPSIQEKRNQYNQLTLMMTELEDLGPYITSLEKLIMGNPGHTQTFTFLLAEWRAQLNCVKVKMKESKQNVKEHEDFKENLLDLNKWMVGIRRRLDTFCDATGECRVEDCRIDAETVVGEFVERELQLHLVEAQGQKVMAKTSEDGQSHVLNELQQLTQSWSSMHILSVQLNSLLMKHRPLRQHEIILTEHNQAWSKLSQMDGLPKDSVSHGRSGELQYDDSPRNHRKVFETWLHGENRELSRLLKHQGPLSSKQLEEGQRRLEELQSHLAHGQSLFQRLCVAQAEGQLDGQTLDELRHNWTLYRTNLRKARNMGIRLVQKDCKMCSERPLRIRKRRSGFLWRVCRTALTLQFLLLCLLLLAVSLPVIHEDSTSCNLANNFAHSFRFMLRHDALPPT